MFHLGPDSANIVEEGIKTLYSLPPGHKYWEKYVERAGKLGMTPEQYLLHKRGQNGLKCVSVLVHIPPLNKNVSPGIRRFCSRRRVYWINFYNLLRDGLVKQTWITGTGAKTREVKPYMLEAHLLSGVRNADYTAETELIFERVPHGIVAVDNGIIPPSYLIEIPSRLEGEMCFPDEYSNLKGKCVSIRVNGEVGKYKVGKYTAVTYYGRSLNSEVLVTSVMSYPDLERAISNEVLVLSDKDWKHLAEDYNGGPVDVVRFHESQTGKR